MRLPADKIREREELAAQLDRRQRIVFTNGCFDLLHVGHLRTLLQARAWGDCLVVGINSDSSVRGLKGPDRPLVGERERAELIAGLECVDYVVIFAEATPAETLRVLRPNLHVKGGDYRSEDLPEAAVVKAYGGEVRLTGMVEGRSTSALAARLRQP